LQEDVEESWRKNVKEQQLHNVFKRMGKRKMG